MRRHKRAMLMPWAGGANPLAYTNKVIAVAPASLIAYWPMAEASGSTAVNEEGTAARNGTYPAPTATPTLGQAGIGDGRTAPTFDGGDYVTIQTASLAAAFNGAEGTLAGWFKVSAAGDWTDGAERNVVRFAVDGNNSVHLRKHTTNNNLLWLYAAGGTGKLVTLATAAPLTWQHMAITWSAAADQMKAYINGAQTGATQTGLGIFAGSLSTSLTFIGANTSIANFWKGGLAHVAAWTTPLSAAQILSIATV